MAHVLQRADLRLHPPSRTVEYQGEPYGSNVSFFAIDNDTPGTGPDLHRHPYSEIFIVHAGRARFTAGDLQVEAGREDIVLVAPDEPHGFVNLGPETLHMVCIHEHGRMITEWLTT